jgi:hypothetical protein
MFIAINFLLHLLLLHITNLVKFCVSIFIFLKELLFPFLFLLRLIILKHFVKFSNICEFPSFLLLILVSYHSHQKGTPYDYIFLDLLRLILWPDIQSILERSLFVLEKRGVLSVGWNVLIELLGSLSLQCNSSPVSLLIFCLNCLSVVESGPLRSPTIIIS